MKPIELKPTSHFNGKDEIYELFIDGKRYDDWEFSLYKDHFSNDDCFVDENFADFITLKAEDFPDKLHLFFSLTIQPYTTLDFSEVSDVLLMKKDNHFIIKYYVGFRNRVDFNLYFNPALLLKYTAEAASKLGMENCDYMNEDEHVFARIYYRSQAQGAIGSLFEEGKKLINTALNNAAKEMYEVMGRQLK